MKQYFSLIRLHLALHTFATNEKISTNALAEMQRKEIKKKLFIIIHIGGHFILQIFC